MMEADIKPSLRDLVSAHPRGITTERICKTLRRTPQELGDTFEQVLASGEIIGFAGLWLSSSNYKTLAEEILANLAALHAEAPKSQGFEVSGIAKLLGLSWGPKPLARLFACIADAGSIEVVDGKASLADFQLELTPRQEALLARVLELIESQPVNTPTPQVIAQSLGMPRQAVEEILRLGLKSGKIVHLAENVYYTPTQLVEIANRLREWGNGRGFSPNEVRDWLESTRKYVHPLLEHFDSINLTLKSGAIRKIRLEEG